MAKLCKMSDSEYVFHCPGCECGHMVRVNGPHPVWGWNGSVDSPTFNPSILLNGNPAFVNPTAPRCHSFVRDGRIQFLADSTHKLAGQTVEIPEWE
jgi:hypothetical protein